MALRLRINKNRNFSAYFSLKEAAQVKHEKHKNCKSTTMETRGEGVGKASVMPYFYLYFKQLWVLN